MVVSFQKKQTLVKIWPSSHLNKKKPLAEVYLQDLSDSCGRMSAEVDELLPFILLLGGVFFFRYSQCLRTPEALT